jgi:hypothetical protein
VIFPSSEVVSKVMSLAEAPRAAPLVSRRSTAQALAVRARITPACAEGKRSKVGATAWLLIATRLANGVGASPSIGLKVSGTNRDRVRRELSKVECPNRGDDRPHS